MTVYEQNPFVPADSARHAIWEMLVPRDIDAFLACNWSMVAGDFIEQGFFGLNAHGLDNPDSWRLGYPNLAAYRDDWLHQAEETAKVKFAEPLRPALFRATTLRDIDIGDGIAIVRKKFDGRIARADGSFETLNWQTLYFCADHGQGWKITSFVGYLPFPMGGPAR